MILSEKELEKIIRSMPSIGPYHAGAGEAAHAIAEKEAEKEAEGVVWSEALEKIESNSPIYNNISELRGWVEEARAIADAALQSAPTVLAHAELAQGYDDISETLTYSTGWEPPQDVEIHVEIFGKAQARFSSAKNIKVIVLEGPNALQEQSKAQEPDKENLMTTDDWRFRSYPNFYVRGHQRIGPDGEDLDKQECQPKGKQGQNSEQEE